MRGKGIGRKLYVVERSTGYIYIGKEILPNSYGLEGRQILIITINGKQLVEVIGRIHFFSGGSLRNHGVTLWMARSSGKSYCGTILFIHKDLRDMITWLQRSLIN